MPKSTAPTKAKAAKKNSAAAAVGKNKKKKTAAKQNQPKTRCTKDKVLHSAAVLFLQKGYRKTTIVDIANLAGVNRGSVVFAITNKENLLNMLVDYVLDGQFEASKQLVAGKTEDTVLYYAAECALQLYMAESSEQIREIYAAAYSLPTTSESIYTKSTAQLEPLFRAYNPTWEHGDFYESEIASGSIIRGFMAKPCDHYFTIERKVRAFLRNALTLYHVPNEKLEEALRFVSEIDFAAAADQTVNSLLAYLERRMEETALESMTKGSINL